MKKNVTFRNSLQENKHLHIMHKTLLFKQKSDLLMDSSLNGVLAFLFFEFLESGPFKFMIPKDSISVT